jgi:two-component system chemotaxis sensor kinase CheA
MSNNNMIDDLIANDPEMLESFINESRECLVVAEKDLNCLREVSSEPDPERIERAFRSVHSLKSAAGFLGLDNVSNLALHMEEMLGHLRRGAIAPEVNRLELLLEGVRILDDMLTNPTDSSDIDTGPFLAKLAEHITTHHDE